MCFMHKNKIHTTIFLCIDNTFSHLSYFIIKLIFERILIMDSCNHTPERECGCNAPTRPMPARSMPSRPMSTRSMPDCSMSQPCGNMRNDPLAHLPVGMAYVPWQCFQDVYEPDKAFQYGTIFPELNKPFYGKGGCPR